MADSIRGENYLQLVLNLNFRGLVLNIVMPIIRGIASPVLQLIFLSRDNLGFPARAPPSPPFLKGTISLGSNVHVYVHVCMCVCAFI